MFKRTILFLIAAFLLLLYNCNTSWGQNIPENPNKLDENNQRIGKWTICFNKNWEPTEIKDSIRFYRIIEYDNGKPSGQVIDYYLGDKNQWKGFLKSENPDCCEGKAIYYFENGNVKSIGKYKNCVEEGKWIYYHENGERYYLPYIYKNGQLQGFTYNYILGGNYCSNGKYDSAQIFLNKACVLIKKDLKNIPKKDLAYIYSNLGYIFYLIGDYGQSQKMYKISANNYKEIDSTTNFLQIQKGILALDSIILDQPISETFNSFSDSFHFLKLDQAKIFIQTIDYLISLKNPTDKDSRTLKEWLYSFCSFWQDNYVSYDIEKIISNKFLYKMIDALNRISTYYDNLLVKTPADILDYYKSNYYITLCFELGGTYSDANVVKSFFSSKVIPKSKEVMYYKAYKKMYNIDYLINGKETIEDANTLVELGNIISEEGWLDDSLFLRANNFYDKAINIFSNKNDSLNTVLFINKIARKYNIVGVSRNSSSFSNSAYFENAITYHKRAISILSKFNINDSTVLSDQINEYYQISLSFINDQRYEESKEYYFKLIELEKIKYNESNNYNPFFLKIYDYYITSNDISLSESVLLKVVDFFNSINFDKATNYVYPLILANLGGIYLDIGNYPKADKYFTEAIKSNKSKLFENDEAIELLYNYYRYKNDTSSIKECIIKSLYPCFSIENNYIETKNLVGFNYSYKYSKDTIITFVYPFSPAEGAGLMPGDKIIEFRKNGDNEFTIRIQHPNSDSIFKYSLRADSVNIYKIPMLNNLNYYNKLANYFYAKGNIDIARVFLLESIDVISWGGSVGNTGIMDDIFYNLGLCYEYYGDNKTATKLFDVFLNDFVYNKENYDLPDIEGIPGGYVNNSNKNSEINYNYYNTRLLHIANFYEHKTKDINTANIFYEKAIKNSIYEFNKNTIFLTAANKEYYYDRNICPYMNQFLNLLTNSTVDKKSDNNFIPYLISSLKGMSLADDFDLEKELATTNDSTLKSKLIVIKNINKSISNLYYSTNDYNFSNNSRKINQLEANAEVVEKELLDRLNHNAVDSFNEKSYVNEISKYIKSDNALIDIFSFENSKNNQKGYLAIVITKENLLSPKIIVLNDGNLMEGSYFSNYINKINKLEDDYDSYNNYWAAIDSAIMGKKTIYLSLDGIYNKININTLLCPDGKYLVDVKDIHLISSTSDLLDSSLNITNSNKTALLVGNPDFSLDSSKALSLNSNYVQSISFNDASMFSNRSFKGANVTELPWTQKEVENIYNVLKKNDYSTSTLIGARAIEEEVKLAKYPKILHIATHGFFDKDIIYDKDEYGLPIIDTISGIGSSNGSLFENPLLRSGLLLAGASKTLQGRYDINSGIDNGILTAYEVSNMNLDSTELVVLSACETGLGEIKNGEGVYGLQRAFRIAGAKCIIMSLWKVDDKATQILMTSFYTNWITNGMTKREAFKAAQKELRSNSDYQKPYYWGGFIMLGV